MSESGDALRDEQSNSTFKRLRERTDSADHHLIDALADRIDELEDRARHAEQECDRLLDAVENERAMLRAVIDQMPAGVIVVDALSGRLVLDNEQVNRILQHHYLPAAEAQNLFGEVGFHSDGRPYRPDEWPISRSIATGERVTDEEIAFVRADGTTGFMEVNSAPISCSGGAPRYGVAVISDITERKRHEAIRQQAFDQIEHNMEQFAILGDHIRHPLQVIMARADLMKDEKKAENIREQVKRINGIVRQLDQGWVESRAIREFLRRNDLA